MKAEINTFASATLDGNTLMAQSYEPIRFSVEKILPHEDMDGTVIRQTVEIHFNFMNQPDKYKLIRG